MSDHPNPYRVAPYDVPRAARVDAVKQWLKRNWITIAIVIAASALVVWHRFDEIASDVRRERAHRARCVEICQVVSGKLLSHAHPVGPAGWRTEDYFVCRCASGGAIQIYGELGGARAGQTE